MSFRQEERQKNNCPSRGLGFAAAAIGIGVGAAMYYFFSKRPENQHGEGSSSSEWETNTFGSDAENQSEMDIDSDSYTTVSENLTSDTSVHDDSSEGSTRSISNDSETESLSDYSVDQESEANSFSSDASDSSSGDQQQTTISVVNDSFETDYLTLWTNVNESVSSSDSDIAMEWDVTNSSEGIPQYSTSRRPIRHIFGNIRTVISPRRSWNKITEEEQMNILRDQAL